MWNLRHDQAWSIIRHRTRQSLHSQLLNTLMLPKVFFIYTNSIITYSWKCNKSSMWKISKRQSHITWVCEASENFQLYHDFEWVRTSLSASGIFRNFFKTTELWQILGLSNSMTTHQKTHFQSAIKTLRYAVIYYEMPVK